MTTKNAIIILDALIKQVKNLVETEKNEKHRQTLCDLIEVYEMSIEAIRTQNEEESEGESEEEVIVSTFNKEQQPISMDGKCGSCMYAIGPVKMTPKGQYSYIKCSVSKSKFPFFARTRKACKKYKRKENDD